jgi:Leucine-rich repeat (LRR) protein
MFDNSLNISILNNLTDLTELNLSHNQSIIGQNSLKNLINLEVLKIDNCNINHINFINQFPKLQNFSASSNNIINVPLLQLSELKIFNVKDNEIKKIEGLKNCVKLEEINYDFNKITEIENLEYNLNIKILFINNNILSKIKNINHLRFLQTFQASNNNIGTLENFPEYQKYKPNSLIGTTLKEVVLFKNPLKYSIYDDINIGGTFKYSSTVDINYHLDNMFDNYQNKLKIEKDEFEVLIKQKQKKELRKENFEKRKQILNNLENILSNKDKTTVLMEQLNEYNFDLN